LDFLSNLYNLSTISYCNFLNGYTSHVLASLSFLCLVLALWIHHSTTGNFVLSYYMFDVPA
jgi:hypothetical protein